PALALYILSLHDALPISRKEHRTDPWGYSNRIASTRLSISAASCSRSILCNALACAARESAKNDEYRPPQARSLISSERLRSCSDRKSTRLNSSHQIISY